MSGDDSDPFDASSDDTDELLASSNSKPIATKKSAKKSGGGGGRLKKKSSSIPDADDGSDDEANGLFDSDEEDDGENDNTNSKKRLQQKSSTSPKKSSSKPSSSSSNQKKGPPPKKLSRKEKMEALAKKRQSNNEETSSSSNKKKRNDKNGDGKNDKSSSKESGYYSGDSYDSAQYERTMEDDDFIDTQGEDEEMVKEYYAEQHFDDERPDDDLEEMELKPKKKGRGGSGLAKKRGPDSLSAEDLKDTNNPISMAVERMKKKKKVAESFEKRKEMADQLILRMKDAAMEDAQSLKAKKPGLKKLKMLQEVLDGMIKREMIRPLLEADFLIVAKIWIEPLKDGSLGNVTVREKIIDGITKMNGDTGIDNDDLKRSDFGKLVMKLYTHKRETPEMKRKLKALIEQWSRRIFQKSGDMKNLNTAHGYRRNEGGLVAIARANADMAADDERSAIVARGKKKQNKDLGSILSSGYKQAKDAGRNRVRVPYSKGFQFTIRPENKTGDIADRKTRISSVNEKRESLHKRMLEKKKKAVKNNRSSNISIEGRPTK